jgi:hypothetical protein
MAIPAATPPVKAFEDTFRAHAMRLAKLLNELGRGGKPAIPPSFTPCPLALADRDRREALRDQQSLTAAFFGDPLPGMSALDRRERERRH